MLDLTRDDGRCAMTIIRYPEARYVPGGATEIARVIFERLDAIEAQIATIIAAQGTRWYHGEGPPSDALGNDGDLYLDTTTSDLYQKENSTWL